MVIDMTYSEAKLLSWPLVARIGTKQNAAKAPAPSADRVKFPDFGWLTVDGYSN